MFTMTRVSRTRAPAIGALAMTVLAIAGFAPAASAAVSDTGYQFFGSADGTSAGGLASALTAPASIGGRSLAEDADAVAAVDLGRAVTTGAVTTSTAATEVDGGYQVRSVARVAQVRALGGAITADSIQIVTTARFVNGITSQAVTTTYVGLKIAGVKIPFNVPPNTVIVVPVGSVKLNVSVPVVTRNQALVVGVGLQATLGKAFGNLPAGTTLDIAPTSSAVSATPVTSGHALYAHSYGTRVLGSPGSGVLAEEGAPVSLAPNGTGGVRTVNTVPSVGLDPMATVGLVTDTVSGTTRTTAYAGRASSSVSGLNLFDGLITADVVTSAATSHGTASASAPTLAGAVTFQGLHVGSATVTSVPVNTKVALAFGTLTLNQRLRPNGQSLVVRALDIRFSKAAFGFPAGAEIQIAASRVAVS